MSGRGLSGCRMRRVKALLVHPAFPPTYWGMEYARRLSRRSALLPPLGLLTVAALLPGDWAVRLLDMSVEPLRRRRA